MMIKPRKMGVDTLKKLIAFFLGISLILTSPCSAVAMPEEQEQ